MASLIGHYDIDSRALGDESTLKATTANGNKSNGPTDFSVLKQENKQTKK